MTNDDVRAVETLKHRYAWAFDARDLDAVCEVFWGDAVLDLGDWGGRNGLKEIRDGYARGMRGPGTHLLSNAIVDVDGDEARGRWYFHRFLFPTPLTDHPLELIGRYDDRFSRRDGVWKIASISLEVLWRAPKETS